MIPKNWDNVTLNQFARLQSTLNKGEQTDSEIVNNKIEQASILKDISIEEAVHTPLSEGQDIKALLETPLPTKIWKRFKLRGITYEFNMSAHDLSGGGYMSIMTDVKNGVYENMHQVLFNLAKPVKRTLRGWKRYEFEPSDIPKRIEDFKLMPVSVGYPIAVFFSTLLKDLTNDILDYSQHLTKIRIALGEVKQDLLDGDGQ